MKICPCCRLSCGKIFVANSHSRWKPLGPLKPLKPLETVVKYNFSRPAPGVSLLVRYETQASKVILIWKIQQEKISENMKGAALEECVAILAKIHSEEANCYPLPDVIRERRRKMRAGVRSNLVKGVRRSTTHEKTMLFMESGIRNRPWYTWYVTSAPSLDPDEQFDIAWKCKKGGKTEEAVFNIRSYKRRSNPLKILGMLNVVCVAGTTLTHRDWTLSASPTTWGTISLQSQTLSLRSLVGCQRSSGTLRRSQRITTASTLPPPKAWSSQKFTTVKLSFMGFQRRIYLSRWKRAKRTNVSSVESREQPANAQTSDAWTESETLQVQEPDGTTSRVAWPMAPSSRMGRPGVPGAPEVKELEQLNLEDARGWLKGWGRNVEGAGKWCRIHQRTWLIRANLPKSFSAMWKKETFQVKL